MGRNISAVVVAAVAAAVGTATWTRRRWHDVGATAVELARSYPGEDAIGSPSSAMTLAVDVDAPPERVWPWLVQIGQDRAGLYSYERLENLFGLDIHNADVIHPEWQDLIAGDRVVVVPPGRMGLPGGYAFRVTEVEPPHHLVLRQAPPEHPWNATWTFTLEPLPGGRSRLVSRSRAERQRGLPGAIATVSAWVMEPIVVLMTRRMLHGIADRAESVSVPASTR